MKAIFAGTFDPFTAGHRDIAQRAAGVFGNVTVAVASDTGKTAQPLDVRLKIATESIADIKRRDCGSVFGIAVRLSVGKRRLRDSARRAQCRRRRLRAEYGGV